MSSKENFDLAQIEKNARRAARTAVAFSFLLAAFWSVHSFFIWLFLGATLYCLFLVWYYRTLAGKEKEGMETTASTSSSAVAGSVGQRARIFIPVMLGMVCFAILLKMIFFSTSDVSGTTESEQTEAKQDPSELDNGEQIDKLTNHGNDLYNQGNYDSALYCYNEVLKLDPGNQFALYDKALVFYHQKDYDKTLPVLLECIRLHPDYSEAYWLLGDVYYDRENLDQAKMSFDVAYEKGLRNGVFLQTMASLYETRDATRAIQLYQESLVQDSSLIESYKKLAALDPAKSQQYLKEMERIVNSK